MWLHVKNSHYRLFVPRGPVELMEAEADVAGSGRLGKYYTLLPSGAVTSLHVCLLAVGLVSALCRGPCSTVLMGVRSAGACEAVGGARGGGGRGGRGGIV